MNSTSNLARAIGTNSIPNQINANCSSNSGNGGGGGENENEVELGVEIFQCLQTRTRRVSFQLDQNGEVLVQVLGEKYDREERMIVQNQKNTRTTTRLKLTMDHHHNNSNSTSHNNPNKLMAIEEMGMSTSTSMGMTMTTTTGTCCQQKKMSKTQVLHFDEYEYAHAYESNKTNNGYNRNNPNPNPSPTQDNSNKSDVNKGASATVAGIVVVEDDFAFAARFAQIKDQFEKLTKKTKEEMKKEWLSPLKYNYNYECDFNLGPGSCPGGDKNTAKAGSGPGAGLIGIGTGNEQQSQSHQNHHASLFQSQFQRAGGVMTHDGNFQPWFFGKMTRRESENILNNTKPGTFLLRVSEKTGACCYTVSVSVPFPDNNSSVYVTTKVVAPRKLNCNLNPFPGSGSCPTHPLAPTTSPPTTTTIETSTSCRHFLILPIADSPPPFISYKLVGSSQSFNSLATLIHHHGHAPITKSGGEILLHPCPKSSSFTMIF